VWLSDCDGLFALLGSVDRLLVIGESVEWSRGSVDCCCCCC
jgi:hypothetical protein